MDLVHYLYFGFISICVIAALISLYLEKDEDE